MHSDNWYEELWKEQERKRLGLPPLKEIYVKATPIKKVVENALVCLKQQLNNKEK